MCAMFGGSVLRKTLFMMLIMVVIGSVGRSTAGAAGSGAVIPMETAAEPVTVTLASTAGDPVNAAFGVAASFGAPVTGLRAGQLQVVNATVPAFSAIVIQPLAAGRGHSLLVRADGTAAAWGVNTSGQCAIPAGLGELWSVAAGGEHSLALKTDGTVAAWGDNSSGQCSVPAGLGNVIAIAAGKSHSLALKADGTVAAWGSNTYGQCRVPAGLANVVAIAAGDYHNLALKADGSVVAWGDNTKGICNLPANLGRVKAVAAGTIHSVAIRMDGSVVAWGYSMYGNLDVPAGLTNVVSVAAAGAHSLALKADGTVAAWGDNSNGASMVPAGLAGVTAVAAGWYHSLALKADGMVVAWGGNFLGQITVPTGLTGRQPEGFGYQFTLRPLTPGLVSVQVPTSATASLDGRPNQASNLLTRNYVLPGTLSVAIEPAAAVVAGATWRRIGTAAWHDAGTTEGLLLPGTYPVEFKDTFLGGWKRPASQMATISAGSTTTLTGVYEALPVTATLTRLISDPTTAALKVVAEFSQPVTGLTSASLATTHATAAHLRATSIFSTIAIDGNNRLAIRPDGTVAAWGTNDSNECDVPAGLKGVVALSARNWHCLALMNDGTVAAWGNNASGQCNVPTTLTGVVAIAAGGEHNLALRADGTVAAWGQGAGCNVPANLVGVVAIAAGTAHSLALKADGSVVAWGDRNYSQFEVPAGLGRVVAIAAGPRFSVALKVDGTVAVWGYDANGQCRVPAGLTDVSAISAGTFHVMAQRADGTLVAWGGLSEYYPYTPYGVVTIPAGLGNVTAFAAGYLDNLVLRDDGTLASFPANSYPSTNIPAGLVARQPAVSRVCFDLTPQAPGLATVQVPAGVVSGLGGSPNQASNLLQYDFLPPGELQVNLAPEAVVAQSAQWRRAGSNRWHDSGTTETYYFPGTYPVEFSSIHLTGWEAPPMTSATIPSGARTTLSARYEALPVTVTLTSEDSGPALTSMTVRAAFSLPVSGFTAGKLAITNSASSSLRWGAAFSSLDIRDSHCLALEADGTVRAWGDNANGLASVPAGLRGVVAVATGAYYNLVLKADGTVAAWGGNGLGQLKVPAQLSDVIAIAAGDAHNLALKADGTVVAWGDNSRFQCYVPGGLNNVVAIAAGASHSLALKADGTVVAWGNNSRYQCNVPSGLSNVIAIAAGDEHSMALRDDGTVVVWSDSYYHVCDVPVGLADVVAIGAGPAVCYAVKAGGTVVAWGDNSNGLLNVPAGLSGVVAVMGGDSCALALKSDGSVVSWGADSTGDCTPPADLVVRQPLLSHCAFTLTSKVSGTVSVQAPAGAGLTLGGIASQPSNALQRDLIAPGAIEVNLEPPEALAQGAQWRRVGSIAWRDGGTSESGLRPGQYTLEFKDIGLRGWNCPNNLDVTVGSGETVRLTARYEAQPLTVTLSSHAVDPTVGPITVTANFSMPVSNLTAAKITVNNATLSNLRPLGRIPVGEIGTLATGDNHSLALRSDGTVAAWGYNGYGQCNMPANLSNVVAVAGGQSHSLALKTDGTVVVWGFNNNGEGSVPAGLGNVVAIAAGMWSNLALRSDGTVIAWGASTYNLNSVPVGLGKVTAIATGGTHNLALKADGTVAAWGNNVAGQCSVPANLKDVVAIAGGANHSLALRRDGTLAAWGSNTYGETSLPAGLQDVVAIAAHGNFNLALKADGTVVGWGATFYRQNAIPAGLRDVVGIAVGDQHCLAQRANGTIIGWGSNTYGQCSVPVGLTAMPPVASRYSFDLTLLSSGLVTVQIQAGVLAGLNGMLNQASNLLQRNGVLAGSLAVSLNPAGAAAAGAGWRRVGTTAWRDSGSTETGLMPGAVSVEFKDVALCGWRRPSPVNATIASSATTRLMAQYESNPLTVTLSTTAPNPVSAPFDVVADFNVPVSGFDAAKVIASNAQVLQLFGVTAQSSIDAGPYNCLALRGDGVPVAWGWNGFGQGDIPTGLNDVVAVASGGTFNLALRSDGTVTAWGDNANGQCNVPAGLAGVRAIAAGGAHCLALRSDGTVVAWGDNAANQCAVPAGLSGVVAVAAGGSCSLALRADGTVIGWGGSSEGEAIVPAGLNSVVAIAAGFRASLALRADGTVVAWGTNYYGQRNIPAGLNSVRAIDVGDMHNLALKADGTVVAWGSNNNGQCNVPTGLGGVTAIAAGVNHSMALKADGSLVVWGQNFYNLETPPAKLSVVRQPMCTSYQFQVAPQAEGPVSVQTQAGAARNLAGTPSLASNLLQRNMALGALAVALSPPEAVAAGAKWRRQGTTAWRDSATSEGGLAGGNYKVEFKPVANWTAPSTQTVTIGLGQTLVVTGRYARQTGTVQVQVTPTTATWSFLDGDGKAHGGKGNVTLAGIPTGQIAINWQPLAGYDTPAGSTKALAGGITVTFAANYARQTGGLRVTIDPAPAVAAGVQWRRCNTADWRDSGITETGIPTGSYAVEFKPASGWTAPGNKSVTVSKGQTTQALGSYVRQTGSLKVMITPAAAVTAGARWRRVGTSTWLGSGSTESSVPTGNYTVEFKAITGWKTPASVNVTISNNQATQIDKIYGDKKNAVSWGAWNLYGR